MNQIALKCAKPLHDKNPPIVPLRHYGRWVAAAVLLCLLLSFGESLFTNPRFGWDVVWKYLFDSSILAGLITTIWLTVASMAIGILLGTLLATMRLSENRLLSGFAATYTWLFRGSPLLVQLIFWYNLAALYPKISLNLPFGPTLFSFDANSYITIYVAALLGLSLNEGAYMSEIVRSGLNAVPKGQREAAQALGMSSYRIFFKITLPQAMPVIVPPAGNELIGMLKTSSLVSVVAMQELLYSAQLIYTVNFRTIPLLIVASIWYLALTTILSIGQHFIERHFNKSRSLKSRTTSPSEESNGHD
ncbi:amino acid ABC transporter permease [Pseudomonas sp. NY15181]|uniref:amino acid ABC transporter permease n=1 Tax=Pseudomonas sp. NY15181 TaxID=3400349 RepID=UPI003A893CB9